MRLLVGVSKDVALWFSDLDDGGLSFLDIPLYAQDQKLGDDCHIYVWRRQHRGVILQG